MVQTLAPFPLPTVSVPMAQDALPTMYDLPSDYPDDPGLPDLFHDLQPQILQFTFQPPAWAPERVLNASDLNLYYDQNHRNWYKRPDWVGVVGVDKFLDAAHSELRYSYVVWQEKVVPFVVVELISPGTELEDLGRTTREEGKPPTKWEVYEQIIKIPYYLVFDRKKNARLRGFKLEGDSYRELGLVEGRILIPELELSIGLWLGSYSIFEFNRRQDSQAQPFGIATFKVGNSTSSVRVASRRVREMLYEGGERNWLRWMSLEGELIPLPQEQAAAAELKAQVATLEAQVAKQEADSAQREARRAKREARTAKQAEEAAKQEAITAKQEAQALEEENARLKAMLQALGLNPES